METILERFTELMNEIKAVTDQAMATAEQDAESAKAIIREQVVVLEEASDTLYTIAEEQDKLSTHLEECARAAYAKADSIEAFIDNFSDIFDNVEPELPDHEFVGNCKKCGKDLYYDEYVVDTEVGRLCDKCHQYYMEHGTLDPVEEPWPVG